jgi:hypothetical protein
MQREYTGVYPDSGKEDPMSSGGGEYCISLHRSACVGVRSCERGNRSQVSIEEEGGVLLEMLIGEVEKTPILCFSLAPKSSWPCGRCGRCSGDVPWCVQVIPGCRGNVDDGTARHPGAVEDVRFPVVDVQASFLY